MGWQLLARWHQDVRTRASIHVRLYPFLFPFKHL
jgi:hypothetical protein